MTSDRISIAEILDVLLPFWRAGELTSTAVIAYFYLIGITDDNRYGQVRYFDMQVDLGCGNKCCRDCVKSLTRSGMIEGGNADGRGGAYFALASFVDSSELEDKELEPP